MAKMNTVSGVLFWKKYIKSLFQRHGWVIISYTILRNVITYPCPKYLLFYTHSHINLAVSYLLSLYISVYCTFKGPFTIYSSNCFMNFRTHAFQLRTSRCYHGRNEDLYSICLYDLIYYMHILCMPLITLRPIQNGCHFTDSIFKLCMFLKK